MSESFRQSRLWSLHYYHYAGEIEFRGERRAFRPGWVSLVPPGEIATWIFPSHASHHYVHFRAGTGLRTPLPWLRPLDVGALMAGLPGLFASNLLHANVRLWDVLIFLAGEPAKPTLQGKHPHVQIALSEIRNADPGVPSTSALARRMGVSRSHLGRCFRREIGEGIRAHARRCKIEQALELLRDPGLDIKSVAIECGLPDLQYFNKLIRRTTGLSPRAYRAKAMEGA